MEPFIGQIQLFAFDYAPQDWYECAGQLLQSHSPENQILFALIGIRYGGDGTNTFRLPDLRNASPIPEMKYYIAYRGLFPQKP